jgi:restriction system protein
MPIPSFQELTLPVLKLASDGKEHSVAEAVEAIASQLKLTPEEQAELLPSGRQSRFRNRIAWSVTYLKMAVLLESTGRGRFVISQRGKDVLKSPPPRIDLAFLSQYPEIKQFRAGGKKGEKEQDAEALTALETPQEILEGAFKQIEDTLAEELLQRIKAGQPSAFERLVMELLVKMGYGDANENPSMVVGKPGDGGIDGVIKRDKLGLDVIYVQAKRWDNTVGRPTVQEFAGSLDGRAAQHGVLITTSTFSREALDYVSRINKRIILIDGPRLVRLMIEHGLGVAKHNSYTVYKIDSGYFSDDE